MHHLSRNEFEQAIEKRREIVELRTDLFGDDYWRTGDARRSLQHAEHLAHLTNEQLDELEVAYRCMEAVNSLSAESKYQDAIVSCEKALKIRETILGLRHFETLNCLEQLAELFQKTGDDYKAERLLTQILEIQKSYLGLQHLNVARIHGRIATHPRLEGRICNSRDALLEEPRGLQSTCRREVSGRVSYPGEFG